MVWAKNHSHSKQSGHKLWSLPNGTAQWHKMSGGGHRLYARRSWQKLAMDQGDFDVRKSVKNKLILVDTNYLTQL